MLAREIEDNRSIFNQRHKDQADRGRRRGSRGSSGDDGGGGIAAIAADLKADSQVLQELYASVSDVCAAQDWYYLLALCVLGGGGILYVVCRFLSPFLGSIRVRLSGAQVGLVRFGSVVSCSVRPRSQSPNDVDQLLD